MPHRRRLAALALLFTAATVGRCVYPTEHDSAVHVSITPLKILIRGNDTVVTATAWQMRGPGDSVAIPNVAFVWTSSDPKIATVDNAGHITGVKSGTVYIRAAAANFDKDARSAVDTVRVAASLEVDSLRPGLARYGALVTAFGPGADDVVLATIHNTPLFPYPFSATRDSTGYGRQTFWLMPPAEPDTAIFIGNGVVTSDHDTTIVVRRDIYEPDDTVPYNFDLDAARPWPGTILAPVLIFNPALFFEPLKRDQASGDSTIVAFKSVPPGVLHAIAIYTQAARYGLVVLEGYVSELPADAHEDDNSCNAADLRGAPAPPFRDTLAIENPHDIDWIRFHLAGLTTVQFRLHAFAGIHPDSLKDLDLYVLKVPNPGDVALQLVFADTAAGSDVNGAALLAAGDY